MSLESADKSDLLELIVWYLLGETPDLSFSGSSGSGGRSTPLLHPSIKPNAKLELTAVCKKWILFAHGPACTGGDAHNSIRDHRDMIEYVRTLIWYRFPDSICHARKIFGKDEIDSFVEIEYIISKVVSGMRHGKKLTSAYAMSDIYKIDKNCFSPSRPLGKIYHGAKRALEDLERDAIEVAESCGLFSHIQRSA